MRADTACEDVSYVYRAIPNNDMANIMTSAATMSPVRIQYSVTNA